MIRTALCRIVVAAALGATAFAGDLPRVVLVDPSTLAANIERSRGGDRSFDPVIKRLRRDADKALRQEPVTILMKAQTPPSGDKHDYMSMGKYWWPDPSRPDGTPYIRKDGQVNPETETLADHENLTAVIRAVATLGLAFAITGAEGYAKHAAALTRVWFLDPATRMKPNLDYAQAVPGRSDGRGVGIIDAHQLPELLDGLGLIGGSAAWAPDDRRAMERWCEQYLRWLTESPNGRQEAGARNNHGTWYDVQVVALHLFLGRRDSAAAVLRTRSLARIAAQIEPDGRQPEELARTRSWDYCFFNLRGLFLLAAMGDRVGVDLWNATTPDGRGIRAALDWLLPRVTGGKKWEHEQLGERKTAGLYALLLTAAARYGDGRYRDAALAVAAGGPPSDRVHLALPAQQR